MLLCLARRRLVLRGSEKHMQNNLNIAGWVALSAALAVGADGVVFLHTHTTEGSPTLILGLVGCFLSFSAAAFGIKARFK